MTTLAPITPADARAIARSRSKDAPEALAQRRAVTTAQLRAEVSQGVVSEPVRPTLWARCKALWMGVSG